MLEVPGPWLAGAPLRIHEAAFDVVPRDPDIVVLVEVEGLDVTGAPGQVREACKEEQRKVGFSGGDDASSNNEQDRQKGLLGGKGASGEAPQVHGAGRETPPYLERRGRVSPSVDGPPRPQGPLRAR